MWFTAAETAIMACLSLMMIDGHAARQPPEPVNKPMEGRMHNAALRLVLSKEGNRFSNLLNRKY